MGSKLRKTVIGVKDFMGSVDITDPCYNRDIWCRMNNVQIKPGEYTCAVWYGKDSYELDGETHTYDIVGIIGIYCGGVVPEQKSMEMIGSIGVDAGLAGFFHNKPDFSDAEWSKFCDQIRKGDAWLNEFGFCSSSGNGDGGYDVYAAKVNGEITALEIRFI